MTISIVDLANIADEAAQIASAEARRARIEPAGLVVDKPARPAKPTGKKRSLQRTHKPLGYPRIGRSRLATLKLSRRLSG